MDKLFISYIRKIGCKNLKHEFVSDLKTFQGSKGYNHVLVRC